MCGIQIRRVGKQQLTQTGTANARKGLVSVHIMKERTMEICMQTGPTMLETPNKLFERLQPLANKQHKGDFKAFVARLKRPYYRLSEEDCKTVEILAGDSDVLVLDGKTQVTWGTADGGFALMPLHTPL